MSTLRTRLVAAVVALVLGSVGGLGVLVLRKTGHDLSRQLDERVRAGRSRPTFPFDSGLGGLLPQSGPVDPRDRSTAHVVIGADGHNLLEQPSGSPDDPDPLPKLPAGSAEREVLAGRIVTLPAVDGSLRYRVAVATAGDGVIDVVAAPMTELDASVRSLRNAILAFGGLVTLIAVTVAFLIVRRGLRPVDDMADAATRIADGDLARRVPAGTPGTELGKLSSALNHMLDEIETAFRGKDESERKLRRFVADASHELQTPLTSVRGYAELYREGGLGAPDRLASAMGRIESESRRMGLLVDDLLQLARMDEGRDLASEPVDLREICADAVAAARSIEQAEHSGERGSEHGGEHERSFTCTFDGDTVIVGDALQLRQVVDNLLKNIRVHTNADAAATIAVEGRPTEVELRIEDRGPGIDPGQLDHVFDRFWRADAARTRRTGGSGLGLAITRSIVTAHNGTITVANRPGGGAVFTVTLARGTA